MGQIDERNKRRILVRLIRMAQYFNEKSVGNFAASTAFFFFISLIPIGILLSAMLPLTGIGEEEFVRGITTYTPDVVDGMVEKIIRDAFSSGSGVYSFSVIAIIYASGRGMIALMQGLNAIYDAREHRSYPRIVMVALIYMILLLLSVILFLILGVFADYLYDFIGRHFPVLLSFASEIMAGRMPLILVTSFALFLLMYTYVPAEEQVLLLQVPGAVFSTIGWVVFSKLFSVFMGGGSIYSTYYGSLASIVILMMWMYGCFFIILVGGYINVVFEGIFPFLKERKKAGKKKREESGFGSTKQLTDDRMK